MKQGLRYKRRMNVMIEVLSSGLSSLEASARLEKYGLNQLKEAKKTPLFLQFLEEFKDLMVIILILAAVVSYFLGDRKDAIVIGVIVLLNAAIGFFQKFKAEKALEALKKYLTLKSRVIRDGKEMMIEAKFLVPGDLILLAEGDKIPADATLVEENELRVDESVLTGESIPVGKEISTKIFMGTQVSSGTAKAIVLKTGMETEFGKIAKLTTETKKDLMPLQKELRGIGAFVGKVTLALAGILIIGGIFIQKQTLVDTIIFAASVAVAAVPEGLPTTITVALALGVQRLARQKAIVKQLASVETLGSTTVICSDKTGTITKNELTVTEIVFDDGVGKVTGVGYEPKGNLCISTGSRQGLVCEKDTLKRLEKEDPKFFETFKNLSMTAGLCNDATLHNRQNKWGVFGDPTEGALLTFIEKIGFSRDEFLKQYERIHEIPFTSERKRMTAIYRDKQTKKLLVFTKGAPEYVLPLCELPDETLKKFYEHNDRMALSALRVLAFAIGEISENDIFDDHKKKIDAGRVEQHLEFIGMIGMIDPPRPEVREAVRLTKKAGVQIYIITGDHGLTARAIARDVGIAGDDARIISGAELGKMPEKELRSILKRDGGYFGSGKVIFARVNPGQKLQIVEALKKQGEVIAVTGDGVNDAPALKRADIGIAMGQTGTDVSREAANMVLADDSFATIVAAVREGRTIYENMKKFIFYIFSSNIAELFIIFVPLLFGMIPPLTALLILAVNVGTDIFPALALGVEPPETDIMDHPPRHPTARIMNRVFTNRFLFIGLMAGALVTASYFWALYHEGWRFSQPLASGTELYLKSSTFAFVTLVMIEMANAFNARSDHFSVFRMRFFSNKKLLLAVLASILLAIGFTTIPFFEHALETTTLDLKEWSMIVGISILIIFIEEIRKVFFLKKSNAHGIS